MRRRMAAAVVSAALLAAPPAYADGMGFDANAMISTVTSIVRNPWQALLGMLQNLMQAFNQDGTQAWTQAGVEQQYTTLFPKDYGTMNAAAINRVKSQQEDFARSALKQSKEVSSQAYQTIQETQPQLQEQSLINQVACPMAGAASFGIGAFLCYLDTANNIQIIRASIESQGVLAALGHYRAMEAQQDVASADRKMAVSVMKDAMRDSKGLEAPDASTAPTGFAIPTLNLSPDFGMPNMGGGGDGGGTGVGAGT